MEQRMDKTYCQNRKQAIMKYLLFFLLILLVACEPQEVRNTGTTTGFVPVYMAKEAASTIVAEAPKSTVTAGKIYAYGAYLFQLEQYEGIHIIDNTDPAKAKKIAFLKVPLSTEIAVRGNYLYTNNVSDLVVFDLANITAPKLVKRLTGAFPLVNQSFPPVSGTVFECPDPSKGIIVRWERRNITNAACRR